METKLIKVRAIPRQGFKAFYRGGHRWPEAGRVVHVTSELFDVLQAESMLAKEPPAEGESPEADVLHYIDNRGDDPAHQAHNAGYALRVENEQLKAEKAALGVVLENERLKSEIEALKAKSAPKGRAAT